ncbi:solute carrier family 39 (zinc transporter), member 1/2/3 [Pelomyxa schiedti]|nr:solute carrier family 39 (zinc transporter), member 1/2/3 [Pelomyxa schiedti]
MGGEQWTVAVLKLACLFIVPIESVVGALIPFFLHGQHRFFEILLAVSAGVFLSVGLCHMLADSGRLLVNFDFHGFPMSPFLCTLGFSMVLVFDQLAPHEHGTSGGHGHSHTHVHTDSASTADSHVSDSHCHLMTTLSGKPEDTNDDGHDFIVENVPAHPSHGRHWAHVAKALATTAALSVHSFSSGLALGLCSSLTDVISILIAIIAHEWAETSGLCGWYLKLGLSKALALSFVVLYSCVTPLGVMVGVILLKALATKSNDIQDLVEGTCLGIASGTFVFTAFELLPESLQSGRDKWVKVLGFVVSLTAIACVSIAA